MSPSSGYLAHCSFLFRRGVLWDPRLSEPRVLLVALASGFLRGSISILLFVTEVSLSHPFLARKELWWLQLLPLVPEGLVLTCHHQNPV